MQHFDLNGENFNQTFKSLIHQGHDEELLRENVEEFFQLIEDEAKSTDFDPPGLVYFVVKHCNEARKRGFPQAPRFGDPLIVALSPNQEFLKKAREELQLLRETMWRIY